MLGRLNTLKVTASSRDATAPEIQGLSNLFTIAILGMAAPYRHNCSGNQAGPWSARSVGSEQTASWSRAT